MTPFVRRSAAWFALLGASLVASALALRPAPEPVEAAPAPLRALFAESENVADWRTLEWVDAGRSRRLERGSKWDPGTRDALRLLRNARLERAVGERAADATRYGLAPPASVLSIDRGGDGLEPILEVGRAAPDGMSVYVSSPATGEIAKLPLYQLENLETLFPD